jgi:hypothetical protein
VLPVNSRDSGDNSDGSASNAMLTVTRNINTMNRDESHENVATEQLMLDERGEKFQGAKARACTHSVAR